MPFQPRDEVFHLLGAKLLAAFLSGSMAVIASAADSALDLVSGAVLFLSQRAVARVDVYQYPEGKVPAREYFFNVLSKL